jgi:hypothetical protein
MRIRVWLIIEPYCSAHRADRTNIEALNDLFPCHLSIPPPQLAASFISGQACCVVCWHKADFTSGPAANHLSRLTTKRSDVQAALCCGLNFRLILLTCARWSGRLFHTSTLVHPCVDRGGVHFASARGAMKENGCHRNYSSPRSSAYP